MSASPGYGSRTVESSLGMELTSYANHNIVNIIRSRYAVEGPLALTVDSFKEQAGGKLNWKYTHSMTQLLGS